MSNSHSISFAPIIHTKNPDADIIMSNSSFTVINEWKKLRDEKSDLKNIRMTCFDELSLPLRKGSIDGIITHGILSKISESSSENRNSFFKEAHRALSSKGKLFLCEGKFMLDEPDKMNSEIIKEVEKRCLELGGIFNFKDLSIPYETELKENGFRINKSDIVETQTLKKEMTILSQILDEYGFKIKANTYVIEAEKI